MSELLLLSQCPQDWSLSPPLCVSVSCSFPVCSSDSYSLTPALVDQIRPGKVNNKTVDGGFSASLKGSLQQKCDICMYMLCDVTF